MTTLLVAATGGHLAQLHQLRPRVVAESAPVVWATFDSEQSRSMLANEVVEYVPYTAPRDIRAVLSNVPRAIRIIKRHGVEQVVSTGSAIALSFLPAARALGKRAHYIESAARSEGPSRTGRILQRLPGIELSSQYDSWAQSPWRRGVSVFDDFHAYRVRDEAAVESVVVTLGTIEGYEFRRLIDRVLTIAPSDVRVFWQTGATGTGGLPIAARSSMPQHELHDAMLNADVVIAHSGIGSALGALNVGRRPILVPREARYGEHVDDHQVQIARELSGRSLALHRSPEQLVWDDVVEAASWRIVKRDESQPFVTKPGDR